MTERTVSRSSRWLISALQISLSAGLMLWLVSSLDWAALTRTWAQLDLRWVALSAIFYYLNIVISCYKWKLTLAAEGLSAPFMRLVRWYLIGAFASNILPTEFGGDFGRGVSAARVLGQPARVARSILFERLTGLLVLLVFALVVAGMLFELWWPLGVALVGACGTALVARSIEITLLRRSGRIARFYQKLRDTLSVALGSPSRVVQLLLASMIFHLLGSIGVWVNMRAVHVDLDLGRTMQVATLASAAGALPISLNGWGVREGIYGSLLNGATGAAILAGALLGRALALLFTLSGAIALAFEPSSEPKAERVP